MSQTFVVLDPSLQSFNGHFLTYDKVIAEEIKRRNRRCIVFASRSVEPLVESMLEVVPCFQLPLEAGISDRAIARIFYRDLREACNKLTAPGPKTFFLHTTTYRQIEPAVKFIARSSNPNDELVILLRYSIHPNPHFPNADTVYKYQAALRAIERYKVSGRVKLLTDSDLLQQEYQSITSLPVELVPIPHVGSDDIPEPMTPRTMVYLGNARGTKGFQYLPYIVEQIRKELLQKSWRAEFQANVMFQRDIESVLAVCTLRNEPVKLWEQELSIEAYEDILDRASLVLIPYQSLYYHSQTSGVLAEAIGKGKPVVVPKGTWMAEQVRGTGAGVLFAPGDRVDFVRAVKEAMENINWLRENAIGLRKQWITTHNPSTFVNHLTKWSAAA